MTAEDDDDKFLTVIVYSDIACPWCYVAHERLTKALVRSIMLFYRNVHVYCTVKYRAKNKRERVFVWLRTNAHLF
jgi:predicted DsbA family dithiol-disulfide isomerase